MGANANETWETRKFRDKEFITCTFIYRKLMDEMTQLAMANR